MHRSADRTPTTPRLAAALLAACAVLALGACSADEPTRVTPLGTTPATGTRPPATAAPDGTAPPATSAQGRAVIDRLELAADISCAGPAEVEVPVRYEVRDAASVAFLVDGEQVRSSTAATGSTTLPLSCDGRAHTVVIVAVDDAGRTTLSSRAVLTSTEPRGD